MAVDEASPLDKLILSYLQKHEAKEEAIRIAYQSMTDLQACKFAGKLRVLNISGREWKQHSHFHRPWRYSKSFQASLSDSGNRLASNCNQLGEVATLQSFDSLHAAVLNIVGDIKGLKTLAVYDITVLLGYKYNIRPETVYLHAGALKGAEDLFGARNILSTYKLSEEQQHCLAKLKIHQIEDFLCVCHKQLKELRSKRQLPSWSYA